MTLALPLPVAARGAHGEAGDAGQHRAGDRGDHGRVRVQRFLVVGQTVFGHNLIQRLRGRGYAVVRHRQNSAALENHLACDDGGGHHLGVEFVEHLVQAAPPRRTGRRVGPAVWRGGRWVGPRCRRTSSKPHAPRHIRRGRGPRRLRWFYGRRRASSPTGRPRRTACRWTARPAPRPSAVRRPATARGVRRRGRRSGTGRRARRRSWAGSRR